MRKWVLSLVLGTLFLFPMQATAQAQVVIENVSVNFWPEYDRADMLVINYITLTADTALPATFDLRIPANASIHTVAVGATLDAVSDTDVVYTTKRERAWQIVSIQASGRALQVEYYDAGLKKNGAARAYTYEWLSAYAAQNFAVTLQQPPGASRFKTALELKDEGIHEDGLRYFISTIGAVQSGVDFSFEMSYQKSSDKLTVAQLQVQPVEPIGADTPGRVSFSNYLPYIIGGVGLLLTLGGLAYYFRAERTGGKKTRRRTVAASAAETREGVYCSQCGARAKSADRFCRTCGARITT